MKKTLSKVYHYTVNLIWVVGIIAMSAAAGHFLTQSNPDTATAAQYTVQNTK